MFLPTDRDKFEQSLIAWCLNNEEQFEHISGQIRQKHFSDPFAQKAWPLLLETWDLYEEWPNEGEAEQLLRTRLRTDPMLPPLLDYIKGCYNTEFSGVTGDEVRKWVIAREFMDLQGKLAEFTTSLSSKSPAELASEYGNLRLQFEEALTVAEGEDDDSEDFDPLSDDAIDNLESDIEEDYGAPPLPTGFVRLDARLRDGGVRPHGILIMGPSGGGKTNFCFNVAMHNVSRGMRGVYIAFDDSRAELRERQAGHIMCEEVEFSAIEASGRMPEFKAELKRLRDEQYPGKLILKVLDPIQYTPMDLIRKLGKTVRALEKEDRKNGVPPERQGKIDFVCVDTGNQVKAAGAIRRSEWYEVGQTHQALNIIPRRFKCPLFTVVQTGQQTVGAAQITERDVAEGYAIIKPYKLVLGVAQTLFQYQTDIVVSVTDSLVRDNINNLYNYCIDRDRNTRWKPFSLCVIKNTRGRTPPGGGQANKVKLPMLINYGSCRIIENYSEPESALQSPMQTQRDEVNATIPDSAPTINRRRRVRATV